METVELRHTFGEKLRLSFVVFAAPFWFFWNIEAIGDSPYLGSLTSIALGGINYFAMSFSFVRADAERFCVRTLTHSRCASWDEIESLWVSWPLENSLASSHETDAWREFLTFRGHKRNTLLRAKLNFGDFAARRQMRAFLATKLGDRVQNDRVNPLQVLAR